jgi:CofH subfamily radical SAM domain protein
LVDSQSQRRAEDLLDSIFKVATELVRGERASLLLREDNSTDFVIARAVGLADDVMRRVRVKTGEGVVGLVAQSKRPLLVRHVSSAPIQSGEGTYRSDSFVSVPILVGDDSRGVLSVTDRNDGQPFDDADLETLELLAGHIGQVLVMQEQGEALQRLAETDPLTWLFNRRHFDRRLEAETNRALRAEHLLALLMIDVDRFKLYNDRYGHAVGDEVLKAVASAVKQAVPGLHIHAFSPLEVAQGAQTLGLPVDRFLGRLRDAGLGSLPGTAAEVLDDEVRVTLCPDKLRTDEWLAVVRAAHRLGIRTTSTIMYGHIEQPRSWARHLLRLRALQQETGGFTEFVPLPFVHMEAPIYLKGRARRGPTFREAVLMHAVSRLALHPHITNIQASWVKMGPEGLAACLRAGANDAGGTLMNESITRAAGGEMGQELPPAEMERIIGRIGRVPWQRTTLYQDVPAERRGAWRDAPPLAPILLTPVKRYEGRGALSELRPIGGPR